jgi:hypothetical protein
VQDERGDADGFDALDFVRAELVEASARLLDAETVGAGSQPLRDLVYRQRVWGKFAQRLRGLDRRVWHRGFLPQGVYPVGGA